MKKIVLASLSPRRKEILKLANIEFETAKSDSKEIYEKNYNEENIIKNSLNKVLSAEWEGTEEAYILGADTMVILENVCLVKPQNIIEAFSMLKKLSGKTHKVVTSHTLLRFRDKYHITRLSTSFVTFKKLGFFEILNYLIKFKPFDKAGSYGIQDFITPDKINSPDKASFVVALEGSYYNVMGLDVDLVKNMINEI